jgi:TP901 family phage tail tape measure protein
MANKRLNATITIGGAVTGALKSALGTTRDKLQEIGRTITDLKTRQKELNGVISDQERLGRNGNALRVQYANQELGTINRQIEALRKRQALEKSIGDTQAAIRTANANNRTATMERAGAAFAIGAIFRTPLKAFEDLDAAMNNMQVAMTNSSGSVPMQFEAIKKQTIELGNVLPGTTADFVNLATALKEQGMPINAIVGGALKSAAHLSVVMKMVPEQAGEMVAKLREAFQLTDEEFGNMADFTQRAKFGFGLKSDDLLLGAKYYGGKLNALGMTGAENVRRIYAIQGMAAQQGMDGSTFGTNFSMMLTRVGLMTERLHKNSKEMRAVNAELDKAGIHMTFFDKGGKFAGVENMVTQLDKLKKLSMEKRLQVLTRIFGEEGGRVADLIARNGVDGYNKALQAMDAEASLAQRIDIATSSFRANIEALGGTITNMLAAVGKPVAEMFTPVMQSMNEFVGGPLMAFIERNETAMKVVGGLAAAATGIFALGAGFAGIAWMSGIAASGFVSLYATALRLWPMLTFLGGTVLPMVANAILVVGRAALLNPIGLAITAIAGAAFLIYKNWEPIKGFFVGLFDSIRATVASSFEWIVKKIQLVGEYWSRTKSFFGFSSDQAPATMVAAPIPPAVPRMAYAGAGAGGAGVSAPQTNTFNITQLPGQDSRALADDIMRRMAERQAVQRRSIMFDRPVGQ